MKLDRDFSFGYDPSKEVFKKTMESLTEEGFRMLYFAKTDKDGLFVDFRYFTISDGKMNFYIESARGVSKNGFHVCPYISVSPYTQIQSDYPVEVSTYGELLDYLRGEHINRHWKKDEVHEQDIYFRLQRYGNGLARLRGIAGFREKDVLEHLGWIEMVQNDGEYEVYRFHDIDNEHYFEYELNSGRITG